MYLNHVSVGGSAEDVLHDLDVIKAAEELGLFFLILFCQREFIFSRPKTGQISFHGVQSYPNPLSLRNIEFRGSEELLLGGSFATT